jgi:hypothetical protein
MFLALGGLTVAARADDQSRALSNWQYYSTGASSVRISDEGEPQSTPATQAALAQQQLASQQFAQQQFAGTERNALYLADGTRRPDGLLTNYFAPGAACGCSAPAGTGGACGSCLSDCCDCCATNSARVEYLIWFSRGRNTPPLVSTGPLNGAGTVLFGNDPVGTNLRNGGRVTFSHLFADGITSADVRFWGLEDGSQGFHTNSATTPVFGIPFNQTFGGPAGPAFLPISGGGATNGFVNVVEKNDIIGADAWGRRNWFSDQYGSLDILGGYQFTRLDDSVQMNSSFVNNAAVAGPTFTRINDWFRTQNEFHGGSIGFLAKAHRGAFTIETLAKVAGGNMREAVIIQGSTNAGGLVNQGGVFTQSTNIGRVQHNHFAYIPEVNVNLVYNVTPSLRLITGYSFIYWSRVLLAGNQIDPNINTTQFGGVTPIGGPAQPVAPFARTDFWVQGLSLGGEYRW